MKMEKSEIGKAGEDFAVKTLEKKGYEILDRNFHSRYGEIDIIAKKDSVIAFVEVKTRKTGSMVSPTSAVNRKKREKIVLTAYKYLEDKDTVLLNKRFDVFSIWMNEGKITRYKHIEAAYYAMDFSGRYDIF